MSSAKASAQTPRTRVKNVVHCIRGQVLLEQLRLKQFDIALADVNDPTLVEFFPRCPALLMRLTSVLDASWRNQVPGVMWRSSLSAELIVVSPLRAE